MTKWIKDGAESAVMNGTYHVLDFMTKEDNSERESSEQLSSKER